MVGVKKFAPLVKPPGLKSKPRIRLRVLQDFLLQATISSHSIGSNRPYVDIAHCVIVAKCHVVGLAIAGPKNEVEQPK